MQKKKPRMVLSSSSWRFARMVCDCLASEGPKPLVVAILVAFVASASHLAQQRVVDLLADAVLFVYLSFLGKCIWARAKHEVDLRPKAICLFAFLSMVACVLLAFDLFQYPPTIEGPRPAAGVPAAYRGRPFRVEATVTDRSPGLICEWDTVEEPGWTNKAVVKGRADMCEKATFQAERVGRVRVRITARDFWGWPIFSSSRSKSLLMHVLEPPP